jgi:hypothetical protein
VANSSTKGLDSWRYQAQYVERIMDNAAYTAAHPDDTLVLVGPPRKKMWKAGHPDRDLVAIGMLQAFQVAQQKPTMPVQTIGSGRSFFLSGKSSVTWQAGRLFVKGPNFIKALYANALAAGVKPDTFDEPVRATPTSDYLVNLDSELLLVPFGLAVAFRDKSHNTLGGVYLELCCMNSWTIGANAGQNMIMENVAGMCDRLLPWDPGTVLEEHQSSDEIDEAIGFTDSD